MENLLGGRGRGFLIVNAKSMKKIIDSHKYDPILFVSDDIKWCKKHFSSYKNVDFLEDEYHNKVITDMMVLSMCKSVFGDYDCTFT